MTTGARWFAGIAMALTIAACSASQPPAAPTTGATASPAVSVNPAGSSASPTIASPGPQVAGMRLVTGQVIGSSGLPSYTVEVLDGAGWSGGGNFVTKAGRLAVGFSVWEVSRVPTHPCLWTESLVDPGPTVDDLVRALAAQALRNATPPTDVTLDGHRGKYLQWSVPMDMVVTGDADFAGCDVQPANGHRDFVSFVGPGGGERYQQAAGQVDSLWILDVDGHRLLADATYTLDARAADRDELAAVAASLHFVLP